MEKPALRLYRLLESAYGPQGWWPVVSGRSRPGFDQDGYHPGLEFAAIDRAGRFEIFCGAILTQNTAWHNVAMVLAGMQEQGLFEPERLLDLDETQLAAQIRSAGYHNQKARKLQGATRAAMAGGWLEAAAPAPRRESLLGLWGIGPETADSMLLYIWGEPSFVVDAYTRRLLARLGWNLPFDPVRAGYETLRTWFMQELTTAGAAPAKLAQRFNEYHALIVRHAKAQCSATPKCRGCPLQERCSLAAGIDQGD